VAVRGGKEVARINARLRGASGEGGLLAGRTRQAYQSRAGWYALLKGAGCPCCGWRTERPASFAADAELMEFVQHEKGPAIRIEGMSCYECDGDWAEVAQLVGVKRSGGEGTSGIGEQVAVSGLTVRDGNLLCTACGEHGVSVDQITMQRAENGETSALGLCDSCDAGYELLFTPAGLV